MIWTLLFVAWLALEIYVAVATRTRGSAARDRGSQALLWIVIAGSITFCEFYRNTHRADLFDGGAWLHWVAVALMIAGLVVRISAIRTLGKAFSANVAIRSGQQVCRQGLYGVVRHPSYLGMMLVFIAIGVHARNPVSLAVVTLAPLVALVYRMHVEERALREAFGDDYIQYAHTTARLIPYLY